jgi:YVTN family beta-propeller protein
VGVAVNPDGSNVYVVIGHSNKVSVINMTTNNVTAEVNVGTTPYGVAVNPDGTKVYVTNWGNNTVSVIDTATNTVSATVSGLNYPGGIAVSPDGTKAYVTNEGNNTVSVINTTNNTAYASVNVGNNPFGIAVTPDGKNVYVANQNDNNVSVIDTKTNTFAATVPVGISPAAFGQFIGPMQITPTITWSNPANITYGTALSNTQLDATASVNGTLVYTPPSGTVLSAGLQQTLKTTFTPKDTVNYTTASASVVINVTQATPIITWENATDICHGMPLSYDQLDAAASPATGTFYYSPNVGTVLNTGQHQPLNVTFAPRDSTNYTTATKTVYINISECPEKHGFFHQTEYSTFLPFQWG